MAANRDIVDDLDTGNRRYLSKSTTKYMWEF